MEKKDLRNLIRNQKRLFTDQQLREQSLPIIKRLLENPAIHQAKTILMYYSLPDEVDTHRAIDLLLAAGKTVLLPVVISDTEMELHRYTGKRDLQSGFFQIMEPVGELFTDYDTIDVAVVPGMAFDTRRNRLGRGKGYYDRFLPRLKYTYKIGVCFNFQKLPGIPADDNDVKMDIVI